MITHKSLSDFDPAIFSLLKNELERQEYGLEMIPSENFVSRAVLEAMGSIFTNKYAEGLPRGRYYGGCEVVDELEDIARDRAKELFSVEFANVQPHSGAQANHAVFDAFLKPGDTVLGMRLDHGGHLTHGSPVNFSGKHYNIIAYGVRESDQQIDPNQVRDLALQHKPELIICGASAYSRKIDFAMFQKVAEEVGAVLLADIAHYAGLIVAGEYPDPSPHADVITTTTHKTLRGPRSGLVLGKKEHAKLLNKTVFPGLQGGPHMHTIAAKAVAFQEAASAEFKSYANQIVLNAQALSKALQGKGFNIVSGGTDSHVMLIDLRNREISGAEAQDLLGAAGITVNKNTIPFDPEPPRVCSGIRLGTPAITTRGMKEAEMSHIADFIDRTISKRDTKSLDQIRSEVRDLTLKFPLYRDGESWHALPAL